MYYYILPMANFAALPIVGRRRHPRSLVVVVVLEMVAPSRIWWSESHNEEETETCVLISESGESEWATEEEEVEVPVVSLLFSLRSFTSSHCVLHIYTQPLLYLVQWNTDICIASKFDTKIRLMQISV